MDRKRPHEVARGSDSRRLPSPHHNRPASKQPRRDDRELPASLRGRVVMPGQQAREQQGSGGKSWEQHQQQRDSRPAFSRQQLGSQPGRGREPGSRPDSYTVGRESRPAHAQPLHSRDGPARSSSAPRAAPRPGALQQPDASRQRATQYDMSSKQRTGPSPYDMSSKQHKPVRRSTSAQQQQQQQLSARAPASAQHGSRPAGHFPASQHRPQHHHQQQQQHGGRPQHHSRPAYAGPGRPGQSPSQQRGSSSIQPGGGRDRPGSRDSRDSSRGGERPGGKDACRKERAVEPGGSSGQQRQAPPRRTPAAAAAGEAAVQAQAPPQLNGERQHSVPPLPQQQQQQQQQHNDSPASEQELEGPGGQLVSGKQQVESPGGTQQQEATAAAAAAGNNETADSLEAGRAAALPAATAAAAAAADSSGQVVKRRPIEFSLASLPGPAVDELKPRLSSKYSLPQLAEQEVAAQQQQGSQAAVRSSGDGAAAVRSSGDGGAAGSAGVVRDVGRAAGCDRRGSQAVGRSSDITRSGAAGYTSEHRRSSEAGYSSERKGEDGRLHSQQQQRRGVEGGEKRSPSRVAASRGRSSSTSSRSPSRSRSMLSYSRDCSTQSGGREPAADRHATPARSSQQQQQHGQHVASSSRKGAGMHSSPQQEPPHSHSAVHKQHRGSLREAEQQQQEEAFEQYDSKQSQQQHSAGSSRRLSSPATPRAAAAAAAAGAAAAPAAAASGIARVSSLTPVAAALDAAHGPSLAALRRPAQLSTLPLQPASPLSAPQPATAAAAAAPGSCRPVEVEQRLASLRARRQGMVALQLRGLPLSQQLAYKETWARACKAGRLRPELVDGPLAAARRQAAAAQALRHGFGASLLPPVDPAGAAPVAGRGEEAHIQQLQQLIDAMAGQEASPCCVALPDGGSMLLPAELQGLLW